MVSRSRFTIDSVAQSPTGEDHSVLRYVDEGDTPTSTLPSERLTARVVAPPGAMLPGGSGQLANDVSRSANLTEMSLTSGR
jgi:hypothetical protein